MFWWGGACGAPNAPIKGNAASTAALSPRSPSDLLRSPPISSDLLRSHPISSDLLRSPPARRPPPPAAASHSSPCILVSKRGNRKPRYIPHLCGGMGWQGEGVWGVLFWRNLFCGASFFWMHTFDFWCLGVMLAVVLLISTLSQGDKKVIVANQGSCYHESTTAMSTYEVSLRSRHAANTRTRVNNML